ncbi:MAG TPA: class II glutamine amidotransferase [Pirellulales bacterium]
MSVDGVLVSDAHSLLKQSCGDLRGETHGDGWGIGYYEQGAPRVFRSPNAARESPEFEVAARRAASPIVLAHVRQASVGSRLTENAHPFGHGRWLFMHNGTVTGFAEIRERVLAETDVDLRSRIQGTTDSEHVFYWLLSRLRRAGQATEEPAFEGTGAADLGVLTRVLAEAIPVLDAWSVATGPDEPAKLNFVMTDGVSLVASRFKHNLNWLRLGSNAPQDRFAGDNKCRAVLVASEPIGDQTWDAVPDGQVLSIAADLTSRLTSI